LNIVIGEFTDQENRCNCKKSDSDKNDSSGKCMDGLTWNISKDWNPVTHDESKRFTVAQKIIKVINVYPFLTRYTIPILKITTISYNCKKLSLR